MKEEKLTNWQKVLLTLLITGLIYSFFGTEELEQWDREITSQRPRVLFHLLISPFSALAEQTGTTRIIPGLKEDFHELKGYTIGTIFPGFPRLLAQVPLEIKQILNGFQGIVPQDPLEPEPIPASNPLLDKRPLPVEHFLPNRNAQIPGGESILLMGDSLANSCGTAFIPLVNKREDLKIVKYGKVSANLSNPVFDQWFNNLDEVLMENQFEIVIIMMGANAAQAIDEGETRWEYGSERWEQLYRQRAEKLINKIKEEGVEIYWIGIPPMLNRNYNLKMETHNQRIARICREMGVNFLPVDSVIGNESGNYQEFRIQGGTQVRIRTNDGIHYTRAGGDIIARYILKSIFPDISF